MEAAKSELAEIVESQYGHKVVKFKRVRGGCISKAFKLELDDTSSLFVKVTWHKLEITESYFHEFDILKINPQIQISLDQGVSMFQGEYAGLEALRATNTIRAPEPLLVDEFPSGGSFLLMEHIEFARTYSRAAILAALGENLAALHQATPPASNGGFGFSINNTVGSTLQPNPWSLDWTKFFIQHRLEHQVNLTRDSDIITLGQKIFKNIPGLLDSIPPKRPSLIHGDLWTGNFAVAADTLEPVIFDPACYWADSEAEFGISYMQGGLGADFFNAYNAINPPRTGWKVRREIYMLYHCLNHLNLWGAHWRDLCISTMEKVLALPALPT